MIPLTDDLPDDAVGAISLADAYRNYAIKTLINTYGYSPVVKIGIDLRLHFVAMPDGHIRTVNLARDVDGRDVKLRLSNTPDVKEYVLRGFEDLEDETDSGSRRLTRELEKGFLRLLIRGYLMAWGRENSPLRDWSRIQPSSWKYLRLTQLHLGMVEGPGGALLFDVRVKPSVPSALQRPRNMGRPTSSDIVNQRLSDRLAAELVAPGTLLRDVAKDIANGLKGTVAPNMVINFKTVEGHIRETFNAWKESLTEKAK